MQGWFWTLLFKAVIFTALAAAYYFIVIRGLRWLYPRLPKSRLVDALFRERANRRPDYGPLLNSRGERGAAPGRELE